MLGLRKTTKYCKSRVRDERAKERRRPSVGKEVALLSLIPTPASLSARIWAVVGRPVLSSAVSFIFGPILSSFSRHSASK
ncbi:unnamed protein product [Bursaphelenchus xylophilus]|uniref:(pine wood nematode) hypothetical protein n=1 Tax=Bursaphelenchus xylophilus TaxID=6326 RepID=A0A1I7S3D6_BURXY|nr:unnamed protein product [Bursaphelenchus xylophilus]CAG9116234.1 unnamed protein product [Bursaphelenchus xylophilus]